MEGKYSNLSKEEALRLIEKYEKELKTKNYGLAWDSEREPEKVVLDCKENLPILERAKEKEVKKDISDDNLLIEGDNYHALTVLNYTHKKSIDAIYIDPPYNTGKTGEWKYNDNYVDENDGYKHSKWLNFMEKRLNLAKNLLKKTGIIFVSIDINEAAQLKLLMDNIFGEQNKIGMFTAETPNQTSDKNKIKNSDFLLIWRRSKSAAFSLPKQEQSARCTTGKRSQTQPVIEFPENLKVEGVKDGVYKKTRKTNGKEDITLIEGPIIVKDGKLDKPIKLKARWSNPNDMKKFIKKFKGEIGGRIFNKFGKELIDLYLSSDRFQPQMIKMGYDLPYTILRGFTDKGGSLLKEILGEEPFKYPKHPKFIKYLIDISTEKDSTILDFFAGSGTTGHAVLELNKDDGGNRKFILCTNNEVSEDEEKEFKRKHDLSNSEIKRWQKENKKEWLDFQEENGICSAVCYPRVKKVIEGYDYEGKEKELVWEKNFTLNTLRWGKADEIYQEYEEKREEIKEEYDDYESSFKNNVIRLYGVKEIKGQKEGLGGNLQYFKTSFVKKTQNSDQLKLNLTQKCTQMLCVKENIYNLEIDAEDYKILSSNKKDKFLCVYYNFIDDSFEEFLKELEKIEDEKEIYMFSIDNEVDKDLFKGLDKFNIEPIPQPILNIYRQLIHLNIREK